MKSLLLSASLLMTLSSAMASDRFVVNGYATCNATFSTYALCEHKATKDAIAKCEGQGGRVSKLNLLGVRCVTMEKGVLVPKLVSNCEIICTRE